LWVATQINNFSRLETSLLAEGRRPSPLRPINQGGDLLSEEHCTTGLETQRPARLPADMDNAKLDNLFASCMQRLQRTASQLLHNPQDSEDALQDGLLLAFRNLDQFQGRSRFSTWLHSIVKNAAHAHARKMKCRPQCSLEAELSADGEATYEEFLVDPQPSPEAECTSRERSRILRKVMQALPPRYGLVMHLCDLQGVEPKAASQILGISSSALKTCLFRARRLATRRIRGNYRFSRKSSPNHD